MANAGLLQLLAQGPQVNGVERFQQGQQRGLQLADILRGNEARQYVPGAVAGDEGALAKLLGLDPQTGLAIKQLQIKEDKRPASVQEYEYAKSQGYGGSLLDYQLAQKKAGGTNVNINNAAARGETEYQKTLGKQLAERWGKLAEEGDAAQEELAIVGQLRNVLPQNGGLLTGISGALAEYGIGGEGMSDIQATQALVDRLTPKQRAPGSGSSSDLDIRMFKSGMPSLWRTAEGNAVITDTMEALALNKQARGEIAYKIMNGEMTRKEAVEAFKALPDPFAAFKAYRGRAAAGTTPKADKGGAMPPATNGPRIQQSPAPQGIDPEDWKFMTPEQRALWN